MAHGKDKSTDIRVQRSTSDVIRNLFFEYKMNVFLNSRTPDRIFRLKEAN